MTPADMLTCDVADLMPVCAAWIEAEQQKGKA